MVPLFLFKGNEMEAKTKNRLIDNARKYLHSGWHCSEGILLAVGEHHFPEKLPEILKVATPFCGGVGGTEQELCGAFTGGLIVIGVLFGRTAAGADDAHCLDLTKKYRQQFNQHFGYLWCKDLRKNWIGKPGQPDCAELTAQATGILIDLLEE